MLYHIYFNFLYLNYKLDFPDTFYDDNNFDAPEKIRRINLWLKLLIVNNVEVETVENAEILTSSAQLISAVLVFWSLN